MNGWPDKPLIRINKGSIFGTPLDGKLAVRTPHGGYGVDTHCLPRGHFGSRIDEWEEVTAVPTAALKRLQDTFRGIDVIESLEPPLLEVLSYLPADKPNALDQAVTRVKEVEGVVLHLANFDPEERLALLLGGLATLQAAGHKTPALAMIARTCIEWANLLNPRGDALSEVKARAESDPDWGGFTVMSSLTGDVAAALDDGMSDGPMKPLLTIAQYALAWAAQIIEEEDK